MSTAYLFNNKDQKRPRLVLIEHPRTNGWDLAAPKEAAETTSDLYRFELPVEPGRTSQLEVVQQRVSSQRYAVTEYSLPTLLAHSRDGKASQKVVDAVRRAADMQAELNELRRRMALLDQERNTIHQEQNRIRQNMGSVGRDSELYRQYVAKFTEQESRLEAIARQRDELQQTSEVKQRELETYLRNLNVE
jgi:chromosome segregation ATPase